MRVSESHYIFYVWHCYFYKRQVLSTWFTCICSDTKIPPHSINQRWNSGSNSREKIKINEIIKRTNRRTTYTTFSQFMYQYHLVGQSKRILISDKTNFSWNTLNILEIKFWKKKTKLKIEESKKKDLFLLNLEGKKKYIVRMSACNNKKQRSPRLKCEMILTKVESVVCCRCFFFIYFVCFYIK